MGHLFFEHVGSQPADPVFEIGKMWREDPNPKKINLAVGIYLDGEGKNPVMRAVKEAEKLILEEEKTKTYLPIDGSPLFLQETKKLLFSEPHTQIAAAQTVGGTGALRILGQYLKLEMPRSVYVSDPTWQNHHGVFKAAGLEVKTYPYYNRLKHKALKKEFFDFLDTVEKGAVILLHGCCHNPTGIDFTEDEWKLVLEKFQKRGLFPFFDIAYLGLGDGLKKDRFGVDLFYQSGLEMCVAFSYSKTMDLYRDRVGALFIVNHSHTLEAMQSTIKQIIRQNYSNPPAHGVLVVEKILIEPHLRNMWIDELEEHRKRSVETRSIFFETFEPWILHKKEFKEAKGFFSYLGIKKEEVFALRKESIYLLDDSRMNILGINPSNLARFKEVFERLPHG